MMAALLAAETSLPQVLALPRTEIAHEVAKREVGRVSRLAKERGLDPSFLVHMVAYVTLCQGLEREAILAAIEAEARAVEARSSRWCRAGRRWPGRRLAG